MREFQPGTSSYPSNAYDRAHYGATRQRPSRRPPSRRSARGIVIVAGIVLAVLAALVIGGIFASSHVRTDGRVARSTPVSEWAKGTVPELYQIDPAWSQEPYAGATVETNGCGPTCMTMVYVALTGDTHETPATIAAFSDRNGFTVGGLTDWSFMTQGAALLGLSSSEVGADSQLVSQTLANGTPIIASMLPGDFTTTGHFIVLAGLDEDGRVIVHDPNSPERTEQRWDVSTILRQAANLWEFWV